MLLTGEKFWNREFWDLLYRAHILNPSLLERAIQSSLSLRICLFIIKFCTNFMTFGFNIASLTHLPRNPWYTGTLSLTVTSIKRWDAAGYPAPFLLVNVTKIHLWQHEENVWCWVVCGVLAWFQKQRSCCFIWRRSEASMIASFCPHRWHFSSKINKTTATTQSVDTLGPKSTDVPH